MSASEILEQTQKAFDVYEKSLENYSDAQFQHKRDENTWSLAQMYEHVCMAAKYFFLANTKRCLEKRGGQEGGDKNKYGDGIFNFGGFPLVKLKMPESLNKVELVGKSKQHYLTEIAEIMNGAKTLASSLDADEGTYKTEHPVLGMLNAKEWFQNLEMHTRHHLTQKAELEACLA